MTCYASHEAYADDTERREVSTVCGCRKVKVATTSAQQPQPAQQTPPSQETLTHPQSDAVRAGAVSR